MTFRRWLRNSIDRYKTMPAHKATAVSARTFKEGMNRRLGWYDPQQVDGGTHILDLPEWDVLILLDACRPDVFSGVARQYPWVQASETTSYKSLGGYSYHWLQETVTEDRFDGFADTGLVAWNPYTEFIEDDHGVKLHEVFAECELAHQNEWNNRLGCVPPEKITDAGLNMLGECERVILWYQQPHAPYRTLVDEVEQLTEEHIGIEGAERLTVWNLLRGGEITREEALVAYADNLRWVLDDVERVLEAVGPEPTVRLTADHGELFGEGGRWGHPREDYHPEQLEVPLVKLEQSRVGMPMDYGDEWQATETAEEKLAALGYK